MPLNRAIIKRSLILGLCLWSLFVEPWSGQASPVGVMPPAGGDSKAPGFDTYSSAEDPLNIMEQLESVRIDDRSLFDFPEHALTQPGSNIFDVEVYTGGVGGARTSMSGIERGVRFDRGAKFDAGRKFDNGAPFDNGAELDWGRELDTAAEFDTERTLRLGEERQKPSVVFRREERIPIKPDKEERLVPQEEGGGRIEQRFTKRDMTEDFLTREKEQLEEDLLRSEKVEIRSFKPVQTGLFLKIAIFATALLLLLAGTLKGMIPIKFYFFLTILILILWNPMESLFISILIGLSALLAPILG